MNEQLRNASLALILLLTSFFFFFRTDSIQAIGDSSCSCGTGYSLIHTENSSPYDYQQGALVSKVVVQQDDNDCRSTTSNGDFSNNCYEVKKMGEAGKEVTVKKIGGWQCDDIEKVLFCKTVAQSTPTPTRTPTPTATPASFCTMKTDKLLVWPVSGKWNDTDQFWVKNNTSQALTFEWLLDKWWSHSDDQTGTTTLQPGEKISLGFGAICAKWQLDFRCPGDHNYQRGYVVEKHLSACVTPTSTPVVTVIPTITPEMCEQRTWSCQDCQSYGDENRLCFEDKLEYCAQNFGCSWENGGDQGGWICSDKCQVIPTPTEGPGKNVKFEVTAISCTNTNFDAKVMATENGQPLKGVKVQFEYKNEKIDRVTDDQGIAQAGYSFKGVDQVKARPDGFPEQSARIDDAANCPAPTTTPGTGGGEVLGANTQPQGQVLGVNTLAPTGVVEDLLMKFASLLGTTMTMVGSVLYGQKKRTTSR